MLPGYRAPRFGAASPRLSTIDLGLSTIDHFRSFIHGEIRQPIGILVLLEQSGNDRYAVGGRQPLGRGGKLAPHYYARLGASLRAKL